MVNMEQTTTNQEKQVFDERLSNATNFVNQYNGIMSQLGTGTSVSTSGVGGSSSLSSLPTSSVSSSGLTTGGRKTTAPKDYYTNLGEINKWFYAGGDEDKFKAYLKAQDYSMLASKAKTEEELQNYLEMRQVKANELGIKLGENGISSNEDLYKKYSGKVLTSWRDPITNKEYTKTVDEYNQWHDLRYGTGDLANYGTQEVKNLANASTSHFANLSNIDYAKVLLSQNKFSLEGIS